jgi:ring-1,2-phenylacetyl-CoA epoxidase subunit PaaD
MVVEIKHEPGTLLPPSPGGGGSASRESGAPAWGETHSSTAPITPPRSSSLRATSDPPPPGEGEGALRQRAWAIASQVTDPEIPVLTIGDLGVLRDIKIENGAVEVFITPTYSGCPAMHVIALNIEAELEEAGFGLAKITTVLSPAWTTDWMTEEGRAKLTAYGIAPPAKGAGRRALFVEEAVTCPHCGSAETARISEFGSTACKALYRCRACAEPFDYFKCL